MSRLRFPLAPGGPDRWRFPPRARRTRDAGCEAVATFDRAILEEPGFVRP